MRLIKMAGKSAWTQRNGTIHGSTAERQLAISQGNLQRMDEKPRQFRSRPGNKRRRG